MYTKIVLQQSAYTDLNRPIHTKFNSIAFSILVFLLPLHFPLPITISIFKVATIWITTTNQQPTSEQSTTQKEDGLTVVYFNVLSPQLVRTLFWGRLDLNADSDQWHTYIPTHIYIHIYSRWIAAFVQQVDAARFVTATVGVSFSTMHFFFFVVDYFFFLEVFSFL